MAIAEWPTEQRSGGLCAVRRTDCVAVVEAKRKRKNVSAAIDQAQRYARGFSFKAGRSRRRALGRRFRVPFVFAANGRPYLKQIETESGIWFRDTRKADQSPPRPRRLADTGRSEGQLEIDRRGSRRPL